MSELQCRHCGVTYKLGIDSGSRYYCKDCMSEDPYPFRKSKLLGQLMAELTRYEQERVAIKSRIEAALDLAKKKGFDQRTCQRLRGLVYVNDAKTAQIYIDELTARRTDIEKKTAPATLPGMSNAVATSLPGM